MRINVFPLFAALMVSVRGAPHNGGTLTPDSESIIGMNETQTDNWSEPRSSSFSQSEPAFSTTPYATTPRTGSPDIWLSTEGKEISDFDSTTSATTVDAIKSRVTSSENRNSVPVPATETPSSNPTTHNSQMLVAHGAMVNSVRKSDKKHIREHSDQSLAVDHPDKSIVQHAPTAIEHHPAKTSLVHHPSLSKHEPPSTVVHSPITGHHLVDGKHTNRTSELTVTGPEENMQLPSEESSVINHPPMATEHHAPKDTVAHHPLLSKTEPVVANANANAPLVIPNPNHHRKIKK